MKYKKIKLSDLRFGFELEGAFTTTLYKKVKKYKYGNFKHDSSVDVEYIDGEMPYKEYASKIFSQYDAMIKTMKWFKQENYRNDHTCGLHLHISAKNNNENFMRICGDLNLYRKLQKFAQEEMCSCQKYRFNDPYYFKLATTKRQLISDYYNKTKYRFMRFHHETLEFRFFSPCNHKAENVKKFLDYFLQEFNTMKCKKRFLKPGITNANLNLDYPHDTNSLILNM